MLQSPFRKLRRGIVSYYGYVEGGSTYTFTTWLFFRLLGIVYFIAFLSLLPQIPGLMGENGILPIDQTVLAYKQQLGPAGFFSFPTLAWFVPSTGFLIFLAILGILVSWAIIFGVNFTPLLLIIWLCYLSLKTAGQDFLNFQWDALLLETGFLAIFLTKWRIVPSISLKQPYSMVTIWLLRLLLFKLMFQSGVVKILSGDPAWATLTAMNYHYHTQPIPNPVSWYWDKLPGMFHALETLMTFVIELLVPFSIFATRTLRILGALSFIFLQILILLTGNFAFFNILTIALCVLLLDDQFFFKFLPKSISGLFGGSALGVGLVQRIVVRSYAVFVIIFTIILFVTLVYPIRALPAFIQSPLITELNFNLVNRYGLFAVMTTQRPEIIIEGSSDGQTWLPYEFHYKAGNLAEAPSFVAPHQPRLDWQMWFAALSGVQNTPWFQSLMVKMLQGSPEVMAMFEKNPFPNKPPTYIRAIRYNYEFTTSSEKTISGNWWKRTPVDIYFPAASLSAQPVR